MHLHFLKKHKWIFLIFLLALFLRTWKLAGLPDGFHVDEVKAGWNAYSILKTGADDWGHKFPLYYNSFGDFRPTGYFYLTIPSILIFGLNEFAVRFPGALFGALTVISMYFLVRELAPRKKLDIGNWTLEIFSALLLALSPWHISLSRATSEGIVALFFALTGLWLLVRQLNNKKPPALLPFLLTLLFLLSSYFLYHSARLLIPMFVFITIAFFWWNSRPRPTLRDLPKLHFKLPLVLLFSVSLVTLLFALDPAARGRFNQVSIFKDLDVAYELDKMPFEEGPNRVFVARLFHNKPSVYARRFVNEYTQYISAKFFLVPKEAKPTRYMTSGMGVLTYVEFFLLLAGLVAIAQHKPYASILVLGLVLISPLPAAVTTEDAPNMHRALFMIPFLSIIEAYGLYWFANSRHRTLSLSLSFALLSVNFIFFLHQYFIHNPVGGTLSRNAGAKELALKINSLQGNYDKIYFTEIPDSPYPWLAFFGKYDPATFTQSANKRDKGVWGFQNFTFTSQRCPSRDVFALEERILAVDADACETSSPPAGATLLGQIKRPDGTVVYTLWSR
ncbi:MAG: glycosyltransferase family 39 protein [Candidatus Blackburnbacteria bacterium]|nr:glycosyltransferase family 39 protein [Candidatus Blackburnbacteria bacterium]